MGAIATQTSASTGGWQRKGREDSRPQPVCMKCQSRCMALVSRPIRKARALFRVHSDHYRVLHGAVLRLKTAVNPVNRLF